MVKIQQLRAFDAVVRLGSFALAAQALHVTSAALSLAIRDLEHRLGFRLLERTTRSLRLSEAGRGYLPYVQRVLAELKEADRYAEEVRLGHGVVRVATTQTVIATLLAPALPDLQRRWPSLRLHPIDIAAGDVADSLANGLADLAIGVRLPCNEQFDARPFFTSHWACFLAPTHALARKKVIRWADLSGAPLFMNKSSNLYLQAHLGESIELAKVRDTTTASAGFAMASTGMGVAVFPFYAHPLAKVGGLRAARIQAPLLPHQLEIGFARSPSTSVPLNEVADVLVAAVNTKCAFLK